MLIGILMPSLAGVRKEARKTACKAQLQQLGNAVRMYHDTNKGKYPNAPALPSVNLSGYPPLTDHLTPYLSNDKRAFQCPADETLFPVEGISYFYYTELGERKLTDTTFYKIYQDITKVPVCWDADHFHGGNLPFNWLFVDGHVEHFLDAAQRASGS
jgi:prepilin-type processing-associated H-X9-DG protein